MSRCRFCASWVNPSFCQACREADERKRKGEQSLYIEKWPTENGRSHDRHNRAPQSTYDALLYELRSEGSPALKAPNCRGRLALLSTDQLRELIAALIRLRPQQPTTITDELIGTIGGQL